MPGLAEWPLPRLAGEEKLLQRHRDALGEADADEAAGRHRVAVADQTDRVDRGYHLAAVPAAQRGEKRVLSTLHRPTTGANMMTLKPR